MCQSALQKQSTQEIQAEDLQMIVFKDCIVFQNQFTCMQTLVNWVSVLPNGSGIVELVAVL
jgi:hypothetical protein